MAKKRDAGVRMWTEPCLGADPELSKIRHAEVMGVKFSAKPKCPYVATANGRTAHIAGHLRWSDAQRALISKYVVTMFDGTESGRLDKKGQAIFDDVKSALGAAAVMLLQLPAVPSV